MLTEPAIQMKNISLSIPIYSLEKRSITKRLTNKVINITGGKLDHTKNGTNIIAFFMNEISLIAIAPALEIIISAAQ